MKRALTAYTAAFVAATILLLPERWRHLIDHGLKGPGSVKIEGGAIGAPSMIHLDGVHGASISHMTMMSVDAQDAIAEDRARTGRRRWWQSPRARRSAR